MPTPRRPIFSFFYYAIFAIVTLTIGMYVFGFGIFSPILQKTDAPEKYHNFSKNPLFLIAKKSFDDNGNAKNTRFFNGKPASEYLQKGEHCKNNYYYNSVKNGILQCSNSKKNLLAAAYVAEIFGDGKVTITKADGGQVVYSAENLENEILENGKKIDIFSGDTVETTNATTRIQFVGDNSFLRMADKTAIVITNDQGNADIGEYSLAQVSIAKGFLWGRILSEEKDIQFSDQSLIAGVRGTSISIEIPENTDEKHETINTFRIIDTRKTNDISVKYTSFGAPDVQKLQSGGHEIKSNGSTKKIPSSELYKDQRIQEWTKADIAYMNRLLENPQKIQGLSGATILEEELKATEPQPGDTEKERALCKEKKFVPHQTDPNLVCSSALVIYTQNPECTNNNEKCKGGTLFIRSSDNTWNEFTCEKLPCEFNNRKNYADDKMVFKTQTGGGYKSLLPSSGNHYIPLGEEEEEIYGKTIGKIKSAKIHFSQKEKILTDIENISLSVKERIPLFTITSKISNCQNIQTLTGNSPFKPQEQCFLLTGFQEFYEPKGENRSISKTNQYFSSIQDRQFLGKEAYSIYNKREIGSEREDSSFYFDSLNQFVDKYGKITDKPAKEAYENNQNILKDKNTPLMGISLQIGYTHTNQGTNIIDKNKYIQSMEFFETKQAPRQ